MLKDGYYDIHSHIIPGVDDGAEDVHEALELIKMDIKQGVGTIIATPHAGTFVDDYRYTLRRCWELLSAVNAAGLDIKIMFGTEIRVYPDNIDYIISLLNSDRLPTLNDSGYVLTEFPFWDGSFDNVLFCIDKLISSGYKPIVAHAERCGTYLGIEDIRAIVEHGAKIQINLSDVTHEGDIPEWYELCRAMLNEELVTFVGTDMHNIGRRYPKVTEAVEYMYENLREEYVDEILNNNAQKMLIIRK